MRDQVRDEVFLLGSVSLCVCDCLEDIIAVEHAEFEVRAVIIALFLNHIVFEETEGQNP